MRYFDDGDNDFGLSVFVIATATYIIVWFFYIANAGMTIFQRGNTAILRAIEEGASEQIISWLLATQNGLNVTHRNKVSPQNGLKVTHLWQVVEEANIRLSV